MWRGSKIAVVIPAYCEQDLIGQVIRTAPAFVDELFVIDDASSDHTCAVASGCNDGRVRVVRHRSNRGVGAAIVTGYRSALAAGADVIAVMAGDAQMDPADLERVITPVVRGEADYVKGNRLEHPRWRDMPAARRVAGAWLAKLTSFAIGVPIGDSQCGYTAFAAEAVGRLPLDELWPRFGYPNDLLGLVAAAGLRVAEVPVRPVYTGERSGVRPWHAAVVAAVVLRRWLKTRWRVPRAVPQSAARDRGRSRPLAPTAEAEL